MCVVCVCVCACMHACVLASCTFIILLFHCFEANSEIELGEGQLSLLPRHPHPSVYVKLPDTMILFHWCLGTRLGAAAGGIKYGASFYICQPSFSFRYQLIPLALIKNFLSYYPSVCGREYNLNPILIFRTAVIIIEDAFVEGPIQNHLSRQE